MQARGAHVLMGEEIEAPHSVSVLLLASRRRPRQHPVPAFPAASCGNLVGEGDGFCERHSSGLLPSVMEGAANGVTRGSNWLHGVLQVAVVLPAADDTWLGWIFARPVLVFVVMRGLGGRSSKGAAN
jgi:hypothetical protein